MGFVFRNPAQTIHKPYTELYTKLYTEPYILFFEHESCEWSKCVVSCGGVSKCTFWLHLRRCVRMAKMQGAEDKGAGSVLKYMTKPESDSNEADWLLWHTASKIFHTQRPFSVLTLLAFGDEMYYICIEIWEEPRLPPFFVTFPLKTGVLGAHPGKICLPLILICLPLI